jgi:hypothetical protein
MYAIVPFGLLLAINLMIIYKATRFSRTQYLSSNNKCPNQEGYNNNKTTINARKAQMTRTILTITFLYICLTLPPAIITGFFYPNVIALDLIGPMLINLIDNITFSFPAFNFFILLYSNRLFANEFRDMAATAFSWCDGSLAEKKTKNKNKKRNNSASSSRFRHSALVKSNDGDEEFELKIMFSSVNSV